jgi:hypothetical protein
VFRIPAKGDDRKPERRTLPAEPVRRFLALIPRHRRDAYDTFRSASAPRTSPSQGILKGVNASLPDRVREGPLGSKMEGKAGHLTYVAVASSGRRTESAQQFTKATKGNRQLLNLCDFCGLLSEFCLLAGNAESTFWKRVDHGVRCPAAQVTFSAPTPSAAGAQHRI